jgi:hypothetical protein
MAQNRYSRDISAVLQNLAASGDPQVIAAITEAKGMFYPAGDMGVADDAERLKINAVKNVGLKFVRRMQTRIDAISAQPASQANASGYQDMRGQLDQIWDNILKDEQGYFAPIPGTGGIPKLWLYAGLAGAAYLAFSKKGRKWLTS